MLIDKCIILMNSSGRYVIYIITIKLSYDMKYRHIPFSKASFRA